ncbi:MAG TPA: c-type cytochrome domain-containing protein [Tepidisphaeraceae bacterium]|nr:c-type cytochrome domain-containing protein [Tepidisphaeraceae bacterium]
MVRVMGYKSWLVLAGSICLAAPAFGQTKVNYQDDMLPIFRNDCLNCHNPDKKKGGLDLSSFQAALAGGDDGQVINSGDPDGSKLFRLVTHAEEPTMPPKKDKLPDKELNLIKAWIAGGALETKNGKAIASAKPKLDLSVASTGMQKPTGPLPMPHDFVLEPFARATRAWAPYCMASNPWSPVVAIGAEHQVLLYNPQTLDLLGIVPFLDGEPCVTRFSRNGKMLMIGGGVAAKSGKVALWDITTGKHITDVGNEFDQVIAADLSPDQTTVALSGPTKTLKIYSTQDGTLLHSIKKHTDWVTAISYSPDGVLLASGDRAGGLWVWEAKSGREFYNLAAHKAGITAVAFRDDANYLASASEDGTIKLWDMQSGNQVKSWNAHGSGVLSVEFTHDGRLVSCGRDHVVRLWNANGSRIRQLDGFRDIALDATFDCDGKRVIAADWTGEIRVCDAATGKILGHLDDDPSPLAERLVAGEKKLPEAQAALTQADAKFAQMQTTVRRENDQKLQAEHLIEISKTSVPQRQAALTKAEADLRAANADLDLARNRAKSLQGELDRLNQSAQRASELQRAAIGESKSATSPNATVSARVVSTTNTVNQLEVATARLADESRDARSEQKQEELSLAQATASAKEAQSKLTDFKSELEKARKQLPELAKRGKAMQTELAKLKTARDEAESQLNISRSSIARMKLGEFFQGVYAARNELAARTADHDQAVGGVAALQGDIDQANATIGSLKKMIADSKTLLSAKEEDIARAKAAEASAQTAIHATESIVEQKQAFVTAADQLSQRISAEAAKAPASKTLADAAAKCRALIDSLKADVQSASAPLAAQHEAEKSATAAVTKAQSALEKQKTDLAAAPAKIAAAQDAITKSNAEMASRKAAVDTSTKSMADAKAKADALEAEYQKRVQEAHLDQPATLTASR